MCRILVANDLFFKRVGKANTIRAFRQLERSMGGHGNGLYVADIDALIRNANMSADFAAGIAYTAAANHKKNQGSRVIAFHTRLSSSGGIGSENNHPIRVGKYSAVLLHNGTWSSWRSANTGASSDTNAAAKLVAKYGVAILESPIFDDSGMWVVVKKWRKGAIEIIVVPRGRFSLTLYRSPERVWYLASEKLDIPNMRFDMAASFAKSPAQIVVSKSGSFSYRLGYKIPVSRELKKLLRETRKQERSV